MSKYIPNTKEQQKEMLAEMGLTDFRDLFADIPDNIKLKKTMDLPQPMSEIELMSNLKRLANANCNTEDYTCFLGAGAYDHYIPSVCGNLLSRQEFYTAYTPYQPEISQGTLQAIFEYQSMICTLTGMDVANASMYDGATALAEAALMACSEVKRKSILVSRAVNPDSREVINTYARFRGCKVEEFGFADGSIDFDELDKKTTSDTAACILQSPNFFGIIEDIEKASVIAHKNGAMLVVSCDAISLALLKSPGELGADIVVGEGQSLGNPLNFGGPYLGFFTAKKEFMRKMPGRIVGMTEDHNSRRGFVLTLQPREQHIRREKATSNICSNQALNALAAAIYLSTLGKQGLKEVALQSMSKAHYAYESLIKTGAFTPVFNAPFFMEFALQYRGDVSDLNKKLLAQKIIGGYDLGTQYGEMKNIWLLAVTEKRTRKEIDNLVQKVVAI